MFIVSRIPKLIASIFTCSVIILALAGCSQGNSPVLPESQKDIAPTTSGGLTAQVEPENQVDRQTLICGLFNCKINKDGEIEVTPMRSALATLNVNQFLMPAGLPMRLDIDIVNNTNLLTTGNIIVDLTVNHPFGAFPQFAAFDMMGVFINHGSDFSWYDTNLTFAREGADAVLNNSDGYTRWMNPLEYFGVGLGGYHDGKLGAKGISWTAIINPYKYFCDGLDETEGIDNHYSATAAVNDRGVFRAGESNTRRFDVTFPMPSGSIYPAFQLVFVATRVPPTEIPPNSVPGSFPLASNMIESFYVDVDSSASTVYWNSWADKGGNLVLTLEIFDHGIQADPQGVAGQVSQIVVESPGNFIDGTHYRIFNSGNWTVSAGTSLISGKITVTIPNVHPQGPGGDDNVILITVRSSSGTYDTGTGSPYAPGFPQYHQVMTIDAPGNPNNPPVCSLVADPLNPPMPYSGPSVNFTFDASGSTDPDSDPLSFGWDFNDDGVYSDPWDSGTSSNPTKLFGFTNLTQVGVKVVDGRGGQSICHIPVNITITSNQPPVCSFVLVPPPAIPYTGVPTTFNFNASASFDPNPGDVLTYQWDFNNDGIFGDTFESGTSIQPGKYFNFQNTTQVSLYLNDGNGGDATCSIPVTINIIPPPVTNFQASDGTQTVDRRVRLTWNEAPSATTYMIEQQNPVNGSWGLVYGGPAGILAYNHNTARYCGSANPISYRIKAVNSVGSSAWQGDTGYPKKRRIGVAFFCWAQNTSGTSASVAWSVAQNDFNDANSFWNPYGFQFIMENTSGFTGYYVTQPGYRYLTGTEDQSMHAAYSSVGSTNSFNVYYVDSADGDSSAAYCSVVCPGTSHNTTNVFIIMCKDTRGTGGNTLYIVAGHELGHALPRYEDEYYLDLLDGNPNNIATLTCAQLLTGSYPTNWCNTPPSWTPPMYCDNNATYPEVGDPSIPKNLMWYSYAGAPVSDYNITVGQYDYASTWVSTHEGNYPNP